MLQRAFTRATQQRWHCALQEVSSAHADMLTEVLAQPSPRSGIGSRARACAMRAHRGFR